MADFDLSGKVAVVTGANRGIGQGVAIGLAEAGADIVAVHRSDASRTREAVERLGRRFVSVQADLGETSSVKTVVDAAIAAFGRIDILVNVAGVIRRQPSLEFSDANWDEVMQVNLNVPFQLSRAVAQTMVDRGIAGRIINFASLLSFQGGVNTASYTASKSAIRGLTMVLANEWAPYGITVNAIAPGYIETEMTTALREDSVRSRQILERIPVGRWGKPDDFKGIAVFLASAASSYVTGSTIAVDGGWLAR